MALVVCPRYLLTVLLFLLLSKSVSARPPLVFWHTQFQEWYPAFRPVFDYIRDNNCSDEFHTYLNGDENTPFNPLTGADDDNKLAQPLLNCMLEKTPEFVKSSMGSAQVLLGLTPTMLSVLGPSVEEVAVLCVIGNRQLLSLLLVGGSPAVFPDRAFKLEGPTKILLDHEGRLRNRIWKSWIERSIVAIEYAIAVASIANLAHACYWLGIRSVSNFAPHIPYFPMLWTWIGICTHLVGCWSMHLRVNMKHDYRPNPIGRFIKGQFQPVCEQEPKPFTVRDESYRSIGLSWLSSIMVMVHLIFGSLVWSSFLFIGVGDSVGIITRFMASALASRGIIMYEMGMLRHIHNDSRWRRGESVFRLEQPESVSYVAEGWRGRETKGGQYHGNSAVLMQPETME